MSNENIKVLRELGESRTVVSESAQVWCGYRLRTLGRTEEALGVFETLVAEGAERPALYSLQRAVTLAIDRRHRDAIAAAEELPGERRETVEFMVRAREGIYTGYPEMYERRIARAVSRRFQVELTGSWLRSKHLLGQATGNDVHRVRDEAEAAGHGGAVCKAIAVWGEMNLFDNHIGAQVEQELRENISSHDRYSALAHFLALRAWALGSEELLQLARQATLAVDHRNGAWIPVEILLEEMGHPVPSAQVQWIDSQASVRERWITLHSAVVERARTAAQA
ncbi:hypothetical protein [Janibacter cremeus]|uniref:Tetratricopeptide repeat protein n=1 Tax=Janibacter cremeus TaxID=1285192 RepID=A0A852VTM4_9MICO|nr:hypothetical protein [Janibacter cremeus]NYF99696.1 hypothetical protein [Janibacter cremeus]